MGLDPRRNRIHDEAGLRLLEIGPAGVVLALHDEHLVRPRGLRPGEDRTEVLDHHWLATLERRIEVGDDEYLPGAVGALGHEHGWLGLGPARTERARTLRVTLDGERAHREFVGPLTPIGADGDPAASEWIEAKLRHVPVHGIRHGTLGMRFQPQVRPNVKSTRLSPVYPMAVRAYLDHAATTPMTTRAREAMIEALASFGNPSGTHTEARRARQALEEARDRIADRLGARAREVVFTSGGTEALNLALAGRPPSGCAISAIEHDAVRNAVPGAQEIPVTQDGLIEVDAIPADARCIAVMAANNETGVIQPVGRVRSAAPDAVLVVDAVCAAAWLDLGAIPADLLAISGHKFGGPQGIGALMVREGTVVEPLLHGGGQERERRSGTQNVAGAVAMAVAFDEVCEMRAVATARVAELRDRLGDGLLQAIGGVTETGLRASKTSGNVHLCIEGIESETLLVLLDRAGVAASAGSACASGALHASHVLLAMGIAKEKALGSLRLTLGPDTTEAEITHALVMIAECVAKLRA